MTIPVEITGIVVISVVIFACTLILLGCCLWPTIEELRKVKRLKEKQNSQGNAATFNNVNRERV